MPAFDRSVFVNCPFDPKFFGLFKAVVFTIQYLGLEARTSYERANAGELRLHKIVSLIKGAKFGIHDLSRCRASEAGELSRMNMPFELGIDLGCKLYGKGRLRRKKMLVLDTKRYRLTKALSDLAGSDFRAHGDTQREIIRVVSDWLIHEARADDRSPTEINAKFEDFGGDHVQRLVGRGEKLADINKQSGERLRRAMKRWIKANKPRRAGLR